MILLFANQHPFLLLKQKLVINDYDIDFILMLFYAVFCFYLCLMNAYKSTLLMILNTTAQGPFAFRNQRTQLSLHPQELLIVILSPRVGPLGWDHGAFIKRMIGFVRVRVREGGRQSVFLGPGFGVARFVVGRVVEVAALVMVVMEGFAE